jgi:hypothetical protein
MQVFMMKELLAVIAGLVVLAVVPLAALIVAS